MSSERVRRSWKIPIRNTEPEQQPCIRMGQRYHNERIFVSTFPFHACFSGREVASKAASRQPHCSWQEGAFDDFWPRGHCRLISEWALSTFSTLKC